MIRAAGILFITPDGQALFLKRGPGGDHPLEWASAGGKHEGDETIAETAIRECLEETGYAVDPASMVLHTRSIARAEPQPITIAAGTEALPPSPPAPPAVLPSEDVDYTCFLVRVPEPFIPHKCDEHTAWAWADIATPPEPLHPGMRVALDRLDADELGVARMMAAGLLTSPQRYYNFTLWNIRITGTGLSFRSAIDEFVMRDPAVYMTEDFRQRCNGLPVILEHPNKAVLNSKEFKRRIVGTTFLPYLVPENSEVWAIVKVYDDDTNTLMHERPFSTSPAVAFPGKSDNVRLQLTEGEEAGKFVLFEGKPGILDHIALLPAYEGDDAGEDDPVWRGGAGVWDKGGSQTGVEQATLQADAQTPVLAPSERPRARASRATEAARALTLLDVQLSNLASRRRMPGR